MSFEGVNEDRFCVIINDHKHALTDYAFCSDISTSCEEKTRKFEIIGTTIHERKNLVRIKVDGGIYNGYHPIIRCDYLFQFEDKFSCFIELKGTDINHAVEQLKSSLKHITTKGKRYAYIVARNISPRKSTQKDKLVLMFSNKQFKASFDMKNNQMEKSINKLK